MHVLGYDFKLEFKSKPPLHYKNMPMQYTETFKAVKNEKFQCKMFAIFLIIARGGSNEYPQSMFWSNKRKIGIPLHTPVLLYKSGV